MRPFEYFEPVSSDEACQFLSQHKGEAKILSGGQSLIPLLRLRLISPKYVVSIKGLKELDYIAVDGDGVRIGAVTTHRTVEESELIKSKFPVISEMEQKLASVQVRNWGTIGGSLCHADPAADVAPVLVALGAKVKAKSIAGERVVALEDFFIDYLRNALEPDEILTEIQVPTSPPRSGAVYLRESKRYGDYPISSVGVMMNLAGDLIEDVRITLGASGPTLIRAREAEKLVRGEKVGKDFKEAAERATQEASPITDAEGTAEYKREMIRLLVGKALTLAAERAQRE